MSDDMSILTSRFNNKTWHENVQIRERHSIRCIYGSPQKIKESLQFHRFLFVIEMNNDENRIEGIGIIQNKIQYDNKIRVYEEGDYNRYVYIGKYRVDYTTLLDSCPRIVEAFNRLLFKGKSHSKRGRGLTEFPINLFQDDVLSSIGDEKYIKKQLFDIFSMMNTPTEKKNETKQVYE